MNVELMRTYEDRGWRDIRVVIMLDSGEEYCRTIMYSKIFHRFDESYWHYSPARVRDFDNVEPDDVPDEVKTVYDQHVTVAKVMARGDDL